MTVGRDILGYVVRDRITGFEGIAVAHVVYISGCSQVLVCPRVDKKQKLQDSHWFDEQRLAVGTGEGNPVVLDNTATPGPDEEPPKR